MNVFHIAPTRKSESSAAWRIANAQEKVGIKSCGFVYDVGYSEKAIKIEPNGLLDYKKSSIVNSLFRKATNSGLKSPWSYNFLAPNFSNQLSMMSFDILNVHWIPSTVSIKKLASLGKPIVITLHDVWALTGGCHCNYDCTNWQTGCRNCPQQIRAIPPILRAEKHFQSKMDAYNLIDDLSIVAPSEWIEQMARSSPMFAGRKIVNIPNPVDEKLYIPLSSSGEKRKLKLSSEKKIALVVISGNVNAYHKGIDLLYVVVEALRKSRTWNELIEFVVVGEYDDSIKSNSPRGFNFLGRIDDESVISQVYSAADFVISMSRQDNLPNVLIEAAMCGKPVVAFDIGGISDIVIEGISGLLIEPFNTTKFARAVKSIVENDIKFDSNEIRQNAVAKFSPIIIGNKYLNHYRDILNG